VASLASAGSCPAVISAEAVKSVITASGSLFIRHIFIKHHLGQVNTWQTSYEQLIKSKMRSDGTLPCPLTLN